MIQSTVFIEQLALDTYIGLHKWEMADRQKVICDIEMVIDISQAAETDDIVHSVDYEFISNHLREWAYNHRCKLLEKLANQLVDLLVLHYPSIEKMTIRLTKVGVVPHTAGCGVTVTYTQ